MNIALILNLAVALAVCFALYRMQAATCRSPSACSPAWAPGVLLGAAFQALYGAPRPSSPTPMPISTSSAPATSSCCR